MIPWSFPTPTRLCWLGKNNILDSDIARQLGIFVVSAPDLTIDWQRAPVYPSLMPRDYSASLDALLGSELGRESRKAALMKP
jgi:hypothetical protein